MCNNKVCCAHIFRINVVNYEFGQTFITTKFAETYVIRCADHPLQANATLFLAPNSERALEAMHSLARHLS